MASKDSGILIVFAYDPFASDKETQRSAACAIAFLANQRNVDVQPVYAAANPLSNLSQGFAVDVFEGVREKGQDKLNEVLQGLSLKSVLPLKILQIQSSSQTEQVPAVLHYAQELRASSIVTATRARKGMSRWMFGSFAEALCLRSEIPVLVVNPSWSGDSEVCVKEILFPTDFSDASQEVFRNVIQFARTSGGAICIFHKLLEISAPVWNSPLEAKLSFSSIRRDALKSAEQTLRDWASEAGKLGIPVTTQISTKDEESIADAILEKASATHCLIAMAAQTGNTGFRHLGSVTKKVMRGAECPVWLLHAHSADVRRRSLSDSRLKEYEEKSDFDAPKIY